MLVLLGMLRRQKRLHVLELYGNDGLQGHTYYITRIEALLSDRKTQILVPIDAEPKPDGSGATASGAGGRRLALARGW